MERPIETIETEDGGVVEIHADLYPPDCHPRNPDINYNLSTLVLFHTRYTLGDNAHDYDITAYGSWGELRAVIVRDHPGCEILPVRMYEHSGIGLQAIEDPDQMGYPWNCPWDSGWVGFAFVSREKVKEAFTWKTITEKRRTRMREIIHAEVDEYSQWLDGDVYGLVHKDSEGEIIDSCWGYIGLENAREVAEVWAGHTS